MADLSAGMVHEIDQTYAEALGDLEALVEAVTPWVARHGSAVAAARTAATLLEKGWSTGMLAGLAGVAIVELIQVSLAPVAASVVPDP